MKKREEGSSFWPNYVDIMATLFVVMLVLFGVTFTYFKINEAKLLRIQEEYKQLLGGIERADSLKNQVSKLRAKIDSLTNENARLLVTEQEYNEIKHIYTAVGLLDKDYFTYSKEHIKHIFKLNVKFKTNKSSISKADLICNDFEALSRDIIKAGQAIDATISGLQSKVSNPNIKYLIVIEGQASNDGYPYNYELSYYRALALYKFWQANELDFSVREKCELIVSGSGPRGVPRDKIESNNQRFLISIIPVVGGLGQDESTESK